MPQPITDVLERLVNAGAPFSSSDFAKLAGVTRQAVHRHLKKWVAEGRISVTGKARAATYQRRVVPLRQRVEVASAGSQYRLSARLLLMDVEAKEVELDFTGISALGEEFLDEVFLVWAPAHPSVQLKVVHLPSRFAPEFFAFAKMARQVRAVGT